MRGCRRHPRHGLRPAHRNPRRQGGVSLQPRRACRLRHGRLRDPAAHRRAGPCRRAALYWARARRRGGRTLGFFNRLAAAGAVLGEAQQLAAELAAGPTFANAMTKRMLEMEWAMSVETAIEAEAVAQALCMETEDFARAYRAFAAKQKPVFEGN